MSSKRRGFTNRGIIRRLRIFFCLCFAATTLNCMARSLSFETTGLLIETADGRLVKLNTEIAYTKEQREQGLMYRKSLADEKGMIFIFEQDQILSFWMKNTSIPLSIAFISLEGKILEIYDMEPFNLAPVHSSRSVRFALEVPRAWFSRAGIKVGDRLVNAQTLLKGQ